MKSIRISQYGGPEVLNVKDISIPQAIDDQVLVRVKSIGVNFIDIYQRTGIYPVDLPYIIGLEASGVVEETGDRKNGFKIGDRVAFCGVPGCYAEFVLVPQNKLVSIPDKIDFNYGTALLLQGMTAHYLTQDTYHIGPGDRCLIHAAAGGTGNLLVQMAKNAGAYIIGSVSNMEKARIALNAGADKVINYKEKDFESEVKSLTKGRGVNVVYDSIGKDTFDKSMNCLSHFGLFVSYGQSSGSVPKFDPAILRDKGSLFFTRPSLFHYISTQKELKRRTKVLFDWFIKKKIKVLINKIFDLEQAAEAHIYLQQRKSAGKILLSPDGKSQ
jgi:NADPH2:quinone reductase